MILNINEAGDLTVPVEAILLTYWGSIAHNMYVPKNDPTSIDDIDLLGFVLADIEYYFGLREWGSRGTKEVKDGAYDVVYYEIRKAFSLLLQGNPNVLTALWSNPAHYLSLRPAGATLIKNRHLFVGTHVYYAFAGYAHGQLTRMESREPEEVLEYLGVTAELKARGIHPNHRSEIIPAPADHPEKFAKYTDETLLQNLRRFIRKGENIGYMGDKRKRLVVEHGYDSKNAAHLIRLLRMCKEFMLTGELEVYRTADRDELLSIKRGAWTLGDVKALADQLFAEAKSAKECSTLPLEPDRAGAERLLVEMLSSRHLRSGRVERGDSKKFEIGDQVTFNWWHTASVSGQEKGTILAPEPGQAPDLYRVAFQGRVALIHEGQPYYMLNVTPGKDWGGARMKGE